MTIISASIIVKNEEEIIERCIKTCSQWADEIVIVDTGSTDRTKELAERHPKVKLYDSELFNKDTHYSDFSFSLAKNEAIEKCTGDWVCWWDADDMIDEEGSRKIREIAETTIEPSLFTFNISYAGLVFEHCRMFKSGYGILFDKNHSCHEYLNTLGYPHHGRKDIVIQHQPGTKHVSSGTRNLAILEKDYLERGYKDRRTIFYLGNSYRETGQPKKAVPLYDEYLKISDWREERFFACLFKSQCLFSTKRISEARKAALQAIGEDYRFAEAYCLLGDMCGSEGDYDRAIRWYGLAQNTPYPHDARLFVQEAKYTSYPKAKIEDCHRLKEGAPSAQEKTGVEEGRLYYQLPKDRDLAMHAAVGLGNCTRMLNGQTINVICRNEWEAFLIKTVGCEPLKESKKEPSVLSLPKKINDRHVVDWYCRSAGFLLNQVTSLRIVWEGSDEKNYDVVLTNKNYKEAFEQEGFRVAMLDSQGEFDKQVYLIKQSHVFVGESGWLSNIANALSVPSVVLWNIDSDMKPENAGWPKQENIMITGGLKADDVIAVTKRRLGSGNRSTVSN